MSDKFVLGGYDAKSCPEKTRKNQDPSYADVELDPTPPGDLARMEAGVVFEDVLGLKWAAELGDAFFAIPACDRSAESKARREALTLELIKEPGKITVLWNARFAQQYDTHRTGEPDALVLYGIDDEGTPLWVPIDAKDHKVLEGQRKAQLLAVSPLSAPHPTAAVDTDLGKGTPKKVDAMQLAHYQRMLERLGHSAPGNLGGVIGRSEGIVWFHLDEKLYGHKELGKSSALEYYDHEFGVRVDIATAAKKGKALVGPEWKSDCLSCQWRTACHDELEVDLDHITLLPGITPPRAQAHYSAKTTTRAQLARLDVRTAELVDAGIDVRDLMSWAAGVEPHALISDWKKLRAKAPIAALAAAAVHTAADVKGLDKRTALYSGTKVYELAKSIDRARVSKVGKVCRARGVEAVDIRRSSYEQDFDIEDSNGFVYLIGVRTTGRKTVGEDLKTRAEYREFVTWETTPEAEAGVFAEFWQHVTGAQAYAKSNRYGYRAYHYAHHEPSTFKALAARHAGVAGVPTVAEVEAYFALKDVIDLYDVLSKQLIWPTESVSLKETAKWVRFSWRDSDPGGGNSLAWYEDAVHHPDEAVREENRQRLLEYNADDVAAQVAIRDWLSRLGESRQPGIRLPNVASLDRRFRRRR